MRHRYAELADLARKRKREILRRCGVDLLELSTGEPYEKPFVRFFRERARRVMRAGSVMFMRRALLLIVLLAGVPAAAQLRLEVEPDRGTVGDALTVRLTIQAEAGREPARAKLGPDLGKFTVLEESWSPLSAGRRRGLGLGRDRGRLRDR